MSTTTSTSKTSVGAGSSLAGSSRRLEAWLIILLVFVAGAVTLSIELTASRLFAPYFGTSLFVWANLIGLILLYLTAGYYLGGRLADRYPRPLVLYGLTSVAALLTALIPAIAQPILTWALFTFAGFSPSVFYGSLVSIFILFIIPMILLGCVSPFSIRLLVDQVGHAGRTAGLLYAISTAGSILGTFLPVLVLMPTIGVAWTYLVSAGLLLLVSLVCVLVSLTSNRVPTTKEQ